MRLNLRTGLALSMLALSLTSMVGCSSKPEKKQTQDIKETVKEVVEDKVFNSEIDELAQVAKDNKWNEIYDTKVVEFESRDLESGKEFRGKLDPGEMGITLMTWYNEDGELIKHILHYNDRVYQFKKETDEVAFAVAASLPEQGKECILVKDIPKNVVSALEEPEKWKLNVKKVIDEETENVIWHINYERDSVPYYHVEKVELEVTNDFHVERAVCYCNTSTCKNLGKESYIIDVLNYSDNKIVVPNSVLEEEKELDAKEAERRAKK